MRIADATRDGGDLRSAVGLYRRAHVFYPHAVEPLVALGHTLKEIGAIRQAQKAYKKALALDPAEPNALHALGGIYMRLGETRLALAQYEQLLEADPNDVRALNGKGVALDGLGRHREAQTAYRTGLEIAPERVALLNNLGLSLTLSGQYEDAIALLGPLARERGSAAEPKKNLQRAMELAEAEKAQSAERMTAAVDHPSPELSAVSRTDLASPHRDRPRSGAQTGIAMAAMEEAPAMARPHGQPQQFANLAPAELRAAALAASATREPKSAMPPLPLAKPTTEPQLALRADGFPHGAGDPLGYVGLGQPRDGASQIAQAEPAMPGAPAEQPQNKRVAQGLPSAALRVAAWGEVDPAETEAANHAASSAVPLAERRKIPVPSTHRSDRPVQVVRADGAATAQEREAHTRPDNTVSLAPSAMRNEGRDEIVRQETANAPRTGRPNLVRVETLHPVALPGAPLRYDESVLEAAEFASAMPEPSVVNADTSADASTLKRPSKRRSRSAKTDDGEYRVQLSAQRDVVRAYRSWSILSEQLTDLLADYNPEVNWVDLGPLHGVFFRVRTDPPIARADADALCARIKARGADCFVAEANSDVGESPEPNKASKPGN